jgi:hypothetical protein
LLSIFPKENVLTVENLDILLINAQNRLKQVINALKIVESEKENIFRIFQNNDFSNYSSENDFLTSYDSNYHSDSEFSKKNIKIGCIDSCCNNTKSDV